MQPMLVKPLLMLVKLAQVSAPDQSFIRAQSMPPLPLPVADAVVRLETSLV